MSRSAQVRAVWLLWILAAAAWLAPLASGYFLADDFAFVLTLARSDARGALLHDTASAFFTGQAAGHSHFYRPLAHATFAANYVLFGANASAWILVNAVIHLGCAILVGALALQLHDDRTWRAHAAALGGATIFLCFAPGLEAAAWASARTDALATFFSLAACLAFAKGHARWDRWTAISLVAFVAAMLSKESAAIVPPAILLLALWRRRSEALSLWARLTSALVDALPWIALGLAYLALRYAMFGSAIVVYEQSSPGNFLLEPTRWIAFVRSAVPWFAAQVPVQGPRAALMVLLAVFGVGCIAVVISDRDKRAGVAVALALVFLPVALLAPHAALLSDGSGGRLLHLSGAFLGVLAGVAGASNLARGAVLAAVLFLAVAVASTGTRARNRWIATGFEMQAVAAQVAQLHARASGNEYDLVVLPSNRGPAPFGVQAQAGLMQPPVQQASLSDRVLVQVDDEVAGIAIGFQRGIIANLRRLRLEDLDTKGVEGAAEYPSRVFCWVPGTARLAELPSSPDTSPAAWTDAVRGAMKAAGCTAS
ncbi:MAG TPA: hypothetical protein VGI57_04830 [Usitatibacter sp.]